MRIIKIDPKNRSVSYVEYSGNYTELYTILECDMLELAAYVVAGHALFVDEEGLLNNAAERIGVFFYRDTGHVYVGNGVIVGANDEGEDVEVTIPLEVFKRNVVFGTLETRSGGAVVFVPYDHDHDDVEIP